MPEIAGNAATFINPENITELSHALRTLDSDENLRNQQVARGLVKAKQFDWQRSAEIIFSRLVNMPKTS